MPDNITLKEILQSQQKILAVLSKLEAEDPDRPPTFGEKLADQVVQFVGSWKFISIQAFLLVCYITINSIWLLNINHFDPYPFVLLNLILSFQAAFTAPLILISSNRSEQKDRRMAIDAYQTVLKIEDMLSDLQGAIERTKNGEHGEKQ